MNASATPLNLVSKLALLLALAIGSLAALPAEAYTHTFCVSTRVTTTDSAIGEDIYAIAGATTHPARYAQMKVTRNGATVVNTTYASAGGCLSFSSPYSTGFKLEMWSKARIPASDDPGHFNTLNVHHSNGTFAYWYWYINPGTSGFPRFVSTNQTRRSNLFGIASWILARWSDGLNYKTITVEDSACPTIPDNSCNSGSTVHIHPNGNQKKFLIGHEMGHALVHRWINYHPYASYTQNNGGANCTTPVGMHHAMHSREYQSAALTEGFAQFYSTVAWNYETKKTGWFHYYKPNYKNGSVTLVDVEFGGTGGAHRYLETQCTDVPDGRGVELDWLRALWDYRTNNGDKPSRYQILRQIKNAVTGGSWGNTGAGDAFAAAIADYDMQHGTSFYPRWVGNSGWNGVDH